MTAVEVLTTIFGVIVPVKILFIVFSPRLWLDLTRAVVKENAPTTAIHLALARSATAFLA